MQKQSNYKFENSVRITLDDSLPGFDNQEPSSRSGEYSGTESIMSVNKNNNPQINNDPGSIDNESDTFPLGLDDTVPKTTFNQ